MTVWTDVINEFRENQGGEYVEFVCFVGLWLIGVVL